MKVWALFDPESVFLKTEFFVNITGGVFHENKHKPAFLSNWKVWHRSSRVIVPRHPRRKARQGRFPFQSLSAHRTAHTFPAWCVGTFMWKGLVSQLLRLQLRVKEDKTDRVQVSTPLGFLPSSSNKTPYHIYSCRTQKDHFREALGPRPRSESLRSYR